MIKIQKESLSWIQFFSEIEKNLPTSTSIFDPVPSNEWKINTYSKKSHFF
jgi:hypothetical protein